MQRTKEQYFQIAARIWTDFEFKDVTMNVDAAKQIAVLLEEVDKGNRTNPLTTLIKALQNDGDYAFTWFANLKCLCQDAGANDEEATKVATSFMSNAFGVKYDTDEF